MLSDYFVGQTNAINQLQTAIDISKAKGTILPHTLLIAPPGVGKTMLAHTIAFEMWAPYVELAMPASIKIITNHLMQHHGVLLLDEIHQADRKTLDMLLPFLATGQVRDGHLEIENNRLTVIAATTDPQSLPDAFTSRFRLRPAFEEYTTSDIADVIAFTAASKHDEYLRDEVCNQLAEASLGSPRQAIQLLDTYLDLQVLNGEVEVSDVLSHLNITSQGLRAEHLQYLNALKNQNGVASQATVAQMTFMPNAAMRWIERDLLRLGIISISSQGRELRSMDWDAEVRSELPTTNSDATLNPYTLEPQ